MSLSAEQLREFDEQGIVFPVRALEVDDARALIPRYQALDARVRSQWKLPQYPKVQLLSPWVYRLATHPVILDAVESIIGPDILIWSSTFFAKKPHDPSYVGWHQDATYWGLEPVESIITVWLALSESTPENGCMQVVPGTHKHGQLDHEQSLERENLLQSGQRACFDVENADKRDICLEPGEFSMHHAHLLHGSGGNYASRPRVGLAVNYIAGDARQTLGWDSCMLARGTHRGQFEIETAPEGELDERAVRAYARALEAPSGIGLAAKRAANA